MCLEIYELDSACFLTSPELTWQAALKTTKTKSDLLTDIKMVLMIEKNIKVSMCHAIHRCAKDKVWKNNIEKVESCFKLA